MKKINLLIITALSVFLYNCSETKDLFSIATKDLKQVYKPTETVNLSIENVENAKIDSVIYFSNDIKLGKSTENAVFNLKLEKLQFGIQDIKAIVHSEGEKIECLTSFELVSNITPKLYESKDYTILNTAVSYNNDKFNISLKVNNLLNDKYYSGWSTVTPQRLRSLTAGLTYKF